MGLLVAAYWDDKNRKWMTAHVPASKMCAGVKFGKKACIHRLPGKVITLTPQRRKAVRESARKVVRARNEPVH